jgi:membrane fusion protein, multidrug efflux system
MNFPISSRILLGLLATTTPMVAQDLNAVRTTQPTTSKNAAAYELPGRTEPLEQATIFTRATGIVRERKFDIGDQVQEGQVIALIDTPDVDQAVVAAKATVEQAEFHAKNARALANRGTELLGSQALSREEAEQRQSTASEAEAALRLAQANLDKALEQQKFSTVKAPFSGIVTARNFDRGDRTRGDSTTSEGWLYRLSRLDTLRFVISATPDLALRLGPQTQASVRFNEFPGKTFDAKLARTSRAFDTATGTMRVELQLDNKDLSVPTGLTGTASFKLPAVPNTYLLPNNTLVIRQGKSLVATVQDSKIHFVEVAQGKNYGATVEMTSANLTLESAVILNPNGMLKEGDPVKATPAPPAAPAK